MVCRHAARHGDDRSRMLNTKRGACVLRARYRTAFRAEVGAITARWRSRLVPTIARRNLVIQRQAAPAGRPEDSAQNATSATPPRCAYLLAGDRTRSS